MQTDNQDTVDSRIDEILKTITGESQDIVIQNYNGYKEAREQIKQLLVEARLKGRKDIADKAEDHCQRADFFKPEVEVVMVSSLVWLASLEGGSELTKSKEE